MLSAQQTAELIGSFGGFAVPVSLSISIALAVIGILPSIFVTAANILFFGPLNGFLISWAGEILGAAVSFYLYRLGFKKKAGQLAGSHPLIAKITEGRGIKAGLIIGQARVIPFIPSGIVTLAASVSSVSISIFLAATALGKIPSIALEALVSYDFINIYDNWLRLLLTLAGAAGIYFLLRNRRS